jgi:hypothetical protein
MDDPFEDALSDSTRVTATTDATATTQESVDTPHGRRETRFQVGTREREASEIRRLRGTSSAARDVPIRQLGHGRGHRRGASHAVGSPSPRGHVGLAQRSRPSRRLYRDYDRQWSDEDTESNASVHMPRSSTPAAGHQRGSGGPRGRGSRRSRGNAGEQGVTTRGAGRGRGRHVGSSDSEA